MAKLQILRDLFLVAIAASFMGCGSGILPTGGDGPPGTEDQDTGPPSKSGKASAKPVASMEEEEGNALSPAEEASAEPVEGKGTKPSGEGTANGNPDETMEEASADPMDSKGEGAAPSTTDEAPAASDSMMAAPSGTPTDPSSTTPVAQGGNSGNPSNPVGSAVGSAIPLDIGMGTASANPTTTPPAVEYAPGVLATMSPEVETAERALVALVQSGTMPALPQDERSYRTVFLTEAKHYCDAVAVAGCFYYELYKSCYALATLAAECGKPLLLNEPMVGFTMPSRAATDQLSKWICWKNQQVSRAFSANTDPQLDGCDFLAKAVTDPVIGKSGDAGCLSL